MDSSGVQPVGHICYFSGAFYSTTSYTLDHGIVEFQRISKDFIDRSYCVNIYADSSSINLLVQYPYVEFSWGEVRARD